MLETKGKSKNEEFLSDESGMSESSNDNTDSFKLNFIIQQSEEWIKPIKNKKMNL